MKLHLILSLVLFLTFSCKDRTSSNQSSLTDTISTKVMSVHNQDNGNFHFHLQFDSSKTLLENIYSGYTDTFSLNSQSFRLRLDTAEKSYEKLCVEQFLNQNWKKLFNLYLSSDEYGKLDIDHDGHIDFVKFYHARHYIYFYDPIKKTLSDTVCIMPEDNWLLNKQKLIFYNFYEAMYGNMYPSSQLYTYKDRKPVLLYELLYVENDSTSINEIKLYKYRTSNADDTLFMKTIQKGKNIKFDYKNYWQNNFKTLLGYR